MKIGLIGINSQFVHSNLALYYLRAELPSAFTGKIKEYNNNEPILQIFYDMMAEDFDILAFSVYLWNKDTVNRLTQLMKDAAPEKMIILGGPEPTYSPESFSHYDYIVYGALEPVWAKLLDAIAQGKSTEDIPGIHGEIQFADDWKFPYTDEDIAALKNKLVYYESSRGCPYHCAFCLSSASDQCGFLPLERVKEELLFFLKHRVPVVKLVDRTFNAPRERGKEILRFLLANHQPDMTFHFELKGELLDDETVELLTSAPKGFFQVEIGVQSLNKEVLAVSKRKSSWEQTKKYYQRLIAAENIHTHFDLIAGLPGEDLSSFICGFQEVMSVFPHHLQLGFLKLLPGTVLAAQRHRYGYAAEAFPPYEVVRTADLSTLELRQLKQLDRFMDAYYNNGLLRRTLVYAAKKGTADTFALFSALAEAEDILEALERRFPEDGQAWSSLLRLDHFIAHNGEVTAEEEKAVNHFVQDKEAVSRYLPHYTSFSPREIYKRIRILLFPVKICFDEKMMVEAVAPGETMLLLDYHKKGKQKQGKNKPDLYLMK